MISGILTQELVRFLVAGGVAAIANFCSRFLFSVWLPYVAAVVSAYLVGLTTAFVLMKLFVFPPSSKPVEHQAIRFIVVNLIAVALTVSVSVAASWILMTSHVERETAEAIGHFFGILAPVGVSYLGHKKFSFS